MIVHQITNSYKNYNYNAYIYRNKSYYRHFHSNYELIYASAGKVQITADATNITLYKGELLLISPYTIHSFDINETSEAWIAVFSEDFIISFFEKNKTYEFSKFRCRSEFENFFKKIYLSPKNRNTIC